MSSSNNGLLPEYLKIKDADGSSRKIAYQKISGERKLGLLYVPGMWSHKEGTKAAKLFEFSKLHSLPYVRYDPSGLSDSNDFPLEKSRFDHWIQDAEEVLLKVTDGKQIVVGSSMGGWIATHLATKYPNKIAKLILIAPAINMGDYLFDSFKTLLTPELIKTLESGETIWQKFDNYGTFPISISLYESFNRFKLDYNKKIEINCPVRILHGMEDESVPYEISLKLINSLSTKDVKLIYYKDGDHRLIGDKFIKDLYDQILENTWTD